MASGYDKPKKVQKKEPGEMLEDDDCQFLDFDDTAPPSDFYCRVCKVKMNSDLTWFTHTGGRRHQRKMVSASLGVLCRTAVQDADIQLIKISGGPYNIRIKPINKVAQIQREIDADRKNYFVGLDFVQEILRKSDLLEPIYICTMCKADCQRVTIISHVIGFRHRMNYIKMKDPAKFNRFSNSDMKKSILSELVAEHTRRMEREFGRGIVTVHMEINMKDEGVLDDDLTERPMEIEPAIQSVPNAEIEDAIRQSTPSAHKRIMAKVNYPVVSDARPMIAAEIKKLQDMKFDCYKRHIDLLSDKEQLKIGAEFMVEDYSFIDNFNQEHFGLRPLR